MKITIENLSRQSALDLLNHVKASQFTGIALGGKIGYEHLNSQTINASISPTEKSEDGKDLQYPDLSKYIFSISSDYWPEHSLKEFAGLD